ncbi:MAG: PLP-dependent aspartate aminotransferase family protein [Bacteroidota bacterium]|nr:PLP-dependent aspartate aminotransferase family protein [Bacteroidota bacterium]MDP4233853.1 PLP-dependent aspartate aminotransferase family protein [Bacteroidota bacterium]MDP4243526.1 PLP-dependent aspartate aminotransferase family protein [Bacteroidota bacterium]MDP4289353.1 PLP-dependent aspartate aminotransferase family protein [Bacteroidota bacterium]
MSGFSTKAIHAGQAPEQVTGAVTVPIFQSSTYAQHTLGDHVKYDYGRTINPTREAWETSIAALENGKHGFAFSSGMSAIAAATSMLRPGDHVIAGDDMYGGTYRYFSKVLAEFGVECSYVDMRQAGNVSSAIKKNTRLIYCETPTNPMMNLVDLAAVAEVAKKAKVMSVVDNTFMSPYLQNPLDFGIDIVLHSATKYLGGHSDVIGGVVVTSKDAYAEKIKFYQNAYGAIASPFDSWLMLRSVKTLALRMRAHSNNAQIIAERLHSDKRIVKVHYPGLPTHPQHELALRQMKDFGGMISINTGSLAKAKVFTKELHYFTLGESLGGVESLVCHPVSMTHGSVPPEQRKRLGITDGLVRLSVGVEDVEDLLEDIERGLNAL